MKPLTVSVNEFCSLIGIRRSKAFELIRGQEVDVVRLGRKTLITMHSIEELIERHRISAQHVDKPVTADCHERPDAHVTGRSALKVPVSPHQHDGPIAGIDPAYSRGVSMTGYGLIGRDT